MTKNYITSYSMGGNANTPLVRHNARGLPYTITADRISTNTTQGQRHLTRNNSNNFMLQSHDSRHSGNEFETEKARKRIPVACGRCRQRKIKCTGKESEENPGCTACRLAGYDGCVFDRVNSKVVAYKDSIPLPTLQSYPYDADAGRMYQARSMNQPLGCGPPGSTYTYANYMPQPMYRSHGQFPEQYQKPDCYLNPYSPPDYEVETNTTYSLGPNYTTINHDSMTMPTPYSQQPNQLGRGWVPVQATKADSIYYDSNGLSANYQLPIQYQQQHTYPLRPSVSNETSASFSFSHMASSLPQPSPLAGNDRMLPMPSMAATASNNLQNSDSHRAENALMSLSRTAEAIGYNHIPTHQNTSTPVHHHIQQPQAIEIRRPSNATTSNSLTNSFTTQISYTSCSPPDSQASYSTTSAAACDIYTPTSSSEWISPIDTDQSTQLQASQSFPRRHGGPSQQSHTNQVSQASSSIGQNLHHHSSRPNLRTHDSQADIQYYSTTPIAMQRNGQHLSSDNDSSLSSADQVNRTAVGSATGKSNLLAHGQAYTVPYSIQGAEELERRGASFTELNGNEVQEDNGRNHSIASSLPLRQMRDRKSQGSLRG